MSRHVVSALVLPQLCLRVICPAGNFGSGSDLGRRFRRPAMAEHCKYSILLMSYTLSIHQVSLVFVLSKLQLILCGRMSNNSGAGDDY